MLEVKTVLCATDLSEHAVKVYRVARLIARECHAKLLVLHVTDDQAAVPVLVHSHVEALLGHGQDTHGAGTFDQGRASERLDASGAFLKNRASIVNFMRRRFARDRQADVEIRIEDGDVARTIIRLANEAHCDLIVIGTHARHGVERFLLGSVAERVVREASCPVLTVNPSAAAELAGKLTRQLASPAHGTSTP